MASAPERWEWLQAAYRVFQTMGIEDVRLMTPDEIKELCPIASVDDVLGGLWADREGYIDPSAVVHAYAKAARLRGADVIEHNRVVELHPRSDGGWNVVTEQGTIVATVSGRNKAILRSGSAHQVSIPEALSTSQSRPAGMKL